MGIKVLRILKTVGATAALAASAYLLGRTDKENGYAEGQTVADPTEKTETTETEKEQTEQEQTAKEEGAPE